MRINSKLMKIYPSILETSIEGFEDTFKRELLYFDYFQIDITDGVFVTNRTVSIEEIIQRAKDEREKVKGEKNDTEYSILNTQYSFEFHLMVEDFETQIEKLKELSKYWQIERVFIHLKVISKFKFQSLNNKIPFFKRPWEAGSTSVEPGGLPLEREKRVSSKDKKVWTYGIVLNPEDEVQSNFDFIHQFNTVQIMTVNPGAQGNPFLPECLEKITQLRELNYKGEIILDGGINDKTLPIILHNRYQPDAVCPGSYLKENTKEHLKTLTMLMNN